MKHSLPFIGSILILVVILGAIAFWKTLPSQEVQIEYKGEVVADEEYEGLKSYNNNEKLSATLWNTMLGYIEIEHPGEVSNVVWEGLKSYNNNNQLTSGMWNTLLDNLKAISCSVVEQPIVEQPKTDANCVSTGLNVNNHLYTIPAMNHGASQSFSNTLSGSPANGYTIYNLMVSCINGAHFYATTAETSTKGCNAGFVLNGNTCNSTTATFKFQQYIWRGSMSYQIYETINPLNYNVYDEYRLPGDLQRRSDWYAYEVRVGGYCTLYSRSNEIYQLYGYPSGTDSACGQLAKTKTEPYLPANSFNSLWLGGKPIWHVGNPSTSSITTRGWMESRAGKVILYIDSKGEQWLYSNDYTNDRPADSSSIANWMTRTSNNQAYNTYDYTSMFCGCDEDDTKFDCDKNGRTENLLATRVINGQTDYCYDMGSNGQIRAYRITKQ